MVALHRDDVGTSPPTPLHQVERGGSPRLRVITSRDVPLPRVPASMLVDYVEYEDTGCEFAPSCLRCPFARCKYDDPDPFYKIDEGQRDREIALIRRRYRAPIELLMRTYGLSRRSVYRVLREQGAARPWVDRGGESKKLRYEGQRRRPRSRRDASHS